MGTQDKTNTDSKIITPIKGYMKGQKLQTLLDK